MEKNPLKRAWVWFWYSDTTRFVLILCGGHLLLLVPLLAYVGVDGEARRMAAMGAYLVGIVLAMRDNDYTNLHRIGLDVNRRPLRTMTNLDEKPHA